MTTEDVITNKVGRIGHIELNRPKALNALNWNMVQRLHDALKNWEVDDSVEAVLVTGAEERAFCAGGDVKSIYWAGKAGDVGRDGTLTADFFRAEYTLNYRIANYPKPYLSYLDGVTMGGGVGISVLGSHRIANEHTVFAMPETGIGFFPDVGGSYFLSRQGPIGTLLALTGQSIDYAATLALGFATHFVPREYGRELVDRLATTGVEGALETLCQTPPASDQVENLRSLANACFDCNTLDEVLRRLEHSAAATSGLTTLAHETLEIIRQRSPTSVAVAFEQLRRGRGMSLRDCLIMEYRISQACMQGHDFYEGVRALLIDKDHSPRWSPDTIEGVGPQWIARHFESLGERDLELDRGGCC